MAGIGMRGSEGLALTGVGGIALVGNALHRFTNIRAAFTQAFHKRKDGIAWGDVMTTYAASLATGRSDYEALRSWHGKPWVAKALRVDRVPSPDTVRQHLDNLADGFLGEALDMVRCASLELIRRSGAPITPCSTGHICVDGDTTPQNNGKTKKEGVSRTYMQDVFGFASMFVFAGEEGWAVREEFRPGKQHGQNGATALLRGAIHDLRGLGVEKLLLRLDSAFDAAENYAMAAEEQVDFLVKGNSAHLRWDWLPDAKALPKSAWKREGRNQRVVYLSRVELREFQGREIQVRRVLKVTKWIEWDLKDVPNGHPLIVKRWCEYEAESWLTSLDLPGEKVFELYCGHATPEQYHSEIKGELDLERMPSGAFKTNALVLGLGMLAYNVLKLLGILGKSVIKHRHPAKRHRIRTIIQELIQIPARILTGSNQMKLDIGRELPGHDAFMALWQQLAGPA
jgi:hypothetical protein